eukprot:88971-Rhodomonas_salina.1
MSQSSSGCSTPAWVRTPSPSVCRQNRLRHSSSREHSVVTDYSEQEMCICLALPNEIVLYQDDYFSLRDFLAAWTMETVQATADRIGYVIKPGCKVDIANARMWHKTGWCHLLFSGLEMWVDEVFYGRPITALPQAGLYPDETSGLTMDNVIRRI